MEKFILSLIKKWEKKLCLKVNNFYIRKMKTYFPRGVFVINDEIDTNFLNGEKE